MEGGKEVCKFIQFVLKICCEEMVDVGMRTQNILNKFIIFFYFVYDIVSCSLLCDF